MIQYVSGLELGFGKRPEPNPFVSFLQLRRSPQPGGQLLIHMPAMANGYEADDARLAVDGVDDLKAADAVFPQPVEVAE